MNRTRHATTARLLGMLLTLFVAIPSTTLGQTTSVRVDVTKKRVMTGDPPVLLFPPIRSDRLSGLTRIADYGSHTLFDVPSTAAARLVEDLGREGFDARIASDLENVRFQDYAIDPDTGALTPNLPTTAMPPPTDPDGIFILVLKGYPVETWLEALAAAEIRILQELPPAAYLVRGDRAVLANLKASRPFVRGVFPLLPGMKKVLFGPTRSESPFRQVSIEAADEKPADSLSAHLGVVSDRPVSSSRFGRRVRYSASITELDADVLSHFENVYSIAAVGDVGLSSERQGVILFQQGTPLTLPGTSPDYFALLANRGIGNFSNTRIGVIDTGFNDGDISHADFPGIEGPITGGTGSTFADRDLHGTLVASVIAAFSPAGTRADNQGYRYTLGLAPTATIVLDKNAECGVHSDLATAFRDRLASRNVNVVNISLNTDGPQGCSYGADSREVDLRTRSNDWTFTISAANVGTVESGACPYVRDPGTAKNAITAGATMSFTPLSLGWPDVPAVPVCNPGIAPYCQTCNWSRLNAGVPNAYSDARNIPSFSARQNPNALVKPDLVAPATHVTGPVGVLPPPPPPPEPSGPQYRCSSLSIFCNESVADFPGIARYGYSAGTSFAAPAVAGAVAVVRKWYLNANGRDPSPAMAKAILINGARDIGGPFGAYVLAPDTLTPVGGPIGNIPNEYQGWGMLSLARLLDPTRPDPRLNFYFYDQRSPLLPSSGVWQKYLYVVDPGRDTRITLVWTDPPSETSSQQNYVAINNLNLSAFAGGGAQQWYGNDLSGGYSVLNPFHPLLDFRNNVEQVIIPKWTFAAGTGFLVAVDPFGVMSEPEGQDFALFVDNATEPATSLHTVTQCRIVDTRNPDGPLGGPALQAGTVRAFPLAGQCGVPITARAIALNVTVYEPSAVGSLSLYPGGIATPTAETIHYAAGETRANNGVIAVAPGGELAVRANQLSGTVHVFIDVAGYFQ